METKKVSLIAIIAMKINGLLQSLHMCDAIFILDFQDKAWYLQNITNKMGRHWPNVAASLGVEDDKVRKSILKAFYLNSLGCILS